VKKVNNRNRNNPAKTKYVNISEMIFLLSGLSKIFRKYGVHENLNAAMIKLITEASL